VPRSSMTVDCVREMWTPMSRCTPQHSRQMSTPRFTDSHSGSKRQSIEQLEVDFSGLTNDKRSDLVRPIYSCGRSWMGPATEVKTGLKSLFTAINSWRFPLKLSLLQLFYQCFYYYHNHLRYHYRCHHCYPHHLMLWAIGLYMYCRRRIRNDCFTIYYLFVITGGNLTNFRMLHDFTSLTGEHTTK